MKSFLLHNFSIRHLALSVALVVGVAVRAQAIDYVFFPNDTTVNSYVFGDIGVVGYSGGDFSGFVGPSSPTVNFLPGASIGGNLDVFNDSTVNISTHLDSFIIPGDSSTVNVFGDGSVYAMAGEGNSVINYDGQGTADLEAWDNSRVTFSSGYADFLGTLGNGLIDVTGGNFALLELDESGTANLYGNSLNAILTGEDSTYRYYSLSGRLLDGTLLADNPLIVSYSTGASFNLFNGAVPGPSAALMLVSGLVSGRLRRSRKRLAR